MNLHYCADYATLLACVIFWLCFRTERQCWWFPSLEQKWQKPPNYAPLWHTLHSDCIHRVLTWWSL